MNFQQKALQPSFTLKKLLCWGLPLEQGKPIDFEWPTQSEQDAMKQDVFVTKIHFKLSGSHYISEMQFELSNGQKSPICSNPVGNKQHPTTMELKETDLPVKKIEAHDSNGNSVCIWRLKFMTQDSSTICEANPSNGGPNGPSIRTLETNETLIGFYCQYGQ